MIYWQDKRVITNEQYEEPSKYIASIGNHKKGMKIAFFTMKWNVFCASKNHIPRGKRSKFSHLLTVRLGAVTQPPYGQPDRKIPVVFFDGFPNWLDLLDRLTWAFPKETETWWTSEEWEKPWGTGMLHNKLSLVKRRNAWNQILFLNQTHWSRHLLVLKTSY